MAVTRPVKEGSVTTYQQKVAAGFPDILASEMDADLDTIYAAWNGGVSTANIGDGSITTAKLAPNLQTWQTGAGNPITPIDPTKVITIPGDGSAMVVLGNTTAKARLWSANAGNPGSLILTANRNESVPSQDDATKPSWGVWLNTTGDVLQVRRAPAGSTTQATPFYVQGSDGKTYCTLADSSITRAMITASHAAWQYTTVGMPTSFAIPPTSTWTQIAVTPAITTRGGYVILLCNPGISTVFSGSATAYLTLRVDGATAVAYTKIISSVSSAVPGLVGLWVSNAGSHTFSLWGWLSTGAMATAADNGGALWAIELA